MNFFVHIVNHTLTEAWLLSGLFGGWEYGRKCRLISDIMYEKKFKILAYVILEFHTEERFESLY